MCVRNDLGRELAQSDSLLTHTFNTVAFLTMTYKVTVFICICDIFFQLHFHDNVYIQYACDTLSFTCPIMLIVILFVVVKALQRLCFCVMFHMYGRR